MAERLMARRAQHEVSVDQLAQHVDAALWLGARRLPVQFASAPRECRLALGGERAVIE